MIEGAPKNNNDERGYINHHGDMTEGELFDAVQRHRERRGRGLKN